MWGGGVERSGIHNVFDRLKCLPVEMIAPFSSGAR